MERVGRYRTVRRLGAGGMAEVLEAVAIGDGGFSRRVAIKRILPDHTGDASFVRMFIDEARIASRLHHANVVGVLDFGVADGVPFQILEFVDGVDSKTLQSLAAERGRPMSVEIALHIVTEIAHALDHAHRAVDDGGNPLKIVHRDVSPHNFLVSWDGDVKLSDFGIAIAKNRTEKTQTGMAKGKLSYMAPEQAMAADVDARTDVFALGCALHTLLAGRSPLSGEDSLARLMTGTPLSLDPGIPEDVAVVIERAVRRSKAERYGSASEMADAVGSVLAARLRRDARSVLREWLSTLKPAATVTPPADTMMTAELVLLAESGAGVRQFGTATRPVPGHAPASRVRRIGWATGGAAGLAALGLLLFQRIPEGPALLPSPTSLAALTPPTTPLATSTPESVRATPVVVHRTRSIPASTEAQVAAVTVPEKFGVIRFGGEAALKAEIFIDGESRGFAPQNVEVPVGKHRLELKTPDGKLLGPTVADVTERHTAISPYPWIVKKTAP